MTNNSVSVVNMMEIIKQKSSTPHTQYVIPIFQRKYTWTKKPAVEAYIKDIIEIFNSNDSDYQHFIGFFFYYLDKNTDFNPLSDNNGAFKMYVVDGQQRLVTTFLIILALRDILSSVSYSEKFTEVIETLNNNFLYFEDNKKEKQCRLYPLVDDNDAFKKILEGEINSKEDIGLLNTSNVYSSYKYIKEELEHLLKNEGKIQLETVDKFLNSLSKLIIISVKIEDNDNPQKIFQSINSTGVKLTQADLIRNYILMSAKTEREQKDLYDKYWVKIEKNLNNDSKIMEHFFFIYLQIKTLEIVNFTRIYDNFKHYCEKNYQNEYGTLKLSEILSDVLEYSEQYKYIKLIDNKEITSKTIFKNKKLIREMVLSKNLNTDAALPLIVKMSKLLHEKIIKEDLFLEILKGINIYFVRRAILNLGIQSINKVFINLLVLLESKNWKDESSVINTFRSSLVNDNNGKTTRMPTDKELEDYMLEANMYQRARLLKNIYIHIQFNDTFTYKDVEPKEWSIEHLMPQDGAKWIGENGITKDNHQTHKHRIGNLALFKKEENSYLGNLPFEEKKAKINKFIHWAMNADILKYEYWNTETIEERSKKITNEILKKTFKYFEADDTKYKVFKIHIANSKGEKIAQAELYEKDGSVKIFAGSRIIKNPKKEQYFEKSIKGTLDILLAQNVLQETNEGYIFIEDYSVTPRTGGKVTSLSSTANVITWDNHNGKEIWLDENGEKIKNNADFKATKFGSSKIN
ncbi:GmrSD restriction endonuclease domain-containing protein [Mycoplasma sp. 2248]|uniref:GmrSD restriction endonuclease domain-containing protein n=1 Tax=Mycoplasma sp. 2248 TaxID=3108528 RepID=UPI002B1E57CD|nr:DUF262 domain-containing protein [Mycoplasma sp. 2248]MEA4191278.1 DUF262 domain-containing protein [Mycoplasma sp. 2248]